MRCNESVNGSKVPIQSSEPAPVTLDNRRSAGVAMLGVGPVTIGGRIHCSDQYKRGRVRLVLRRTTDADLVVLKWLPQHFKDVFLATVFSSRNNTSLRVREASHGWG